MVLHEDDRPIFIFDCQPFDWSLTSSLGAYDLAYAIPLYWPPHLRRQFDRPILDHYHNGLLRHGVTDYSREQLFDDYRLSVALCVTIAVEYFRGGFSTRWLDFKLVLLNRTLTAFDDLNCQALF